MGRERLDDAQWAQLEALFAEVGDVPAADRARWLDRHCTDPEVRGALERLIAADEKAAQGTQGLRPPSDVVRGWLAQETDAPADMHEVGPYRLGDEIGHGGSSRVFLATREDLGARVALKLLRYDPLVAPEARRRFEFEHRLLARLEHDHIARLVDAGVTADGTAYLAMEYVEGQPITAYCERHGLDLEARLRLFLQVCDAVGHAHRRGIIHRDLKPGNILVDRRGNVKLLDFGIGKLLEDEEGMPETRTNMRLMTPQYAAPEQLLGEEITTLSDIYSLGVVLYELLAGRRPFGDADDDPRKFESAVLTGVPKNPSGFVDFAPRRAVRGDLDAVVLKALRREPEGRYAGANALAADLRRYLSGHPVEARGGAFAYRARKFLWRHRWPAATATLALIAAASYVVRETTLRREAEAALATSEQVSEFLVSLFSVSDPAQSQGKTLTARDLLDDGAARIETSLADQPAVQLRLMRTIGAVYGELGVYGEAARLLERALEMALAEFGEDDLRTADIQRELGHLYVTNLYKLDAARDLAERALTTYRARAGEDSVEAAEAGSSLARILMLYGENDRAKQLLEHAMNVQRSQDSQLRPAAAETTLGLGNAQRTAGDPEAARRALEEGLARYREAFGNVHPRVASHLVNLGWLSADQGDFEASAAYCREALAINRQLFQQPPVTMAENYGCVSHAERNLGHLDEALAAAREAVRIVRAAGAEETPHLPPQLVLEALVYREMGLHGEVARLNREIAEAYRAAGPLFRMDYANTLVWVADEELKAGRLDQASQTYGKAVAELSQLLEGDDPRLIQPLANLAFVDMLGGDAQAGLEAVDRALSVAVATDRLEPPWLTSMLELRRGEVLATLERGASACEATGSVLAALARAPGVSHDDHARAESAHGYCLAVTGGPADEAFTLMERAFATLRQRHYTTHIYRVQALERLNAASRAVGDPARQARWAAALAEERLPMLTTVSATPGPSTRDVSVAGASGEHGGR